MVLLSPYEKLTELSFPVAVTQGMFTCTYFLLQEVIQYTSF